MSKSGTLTYQMMYELRDFGFSTAIGIGGDPVIGTTHIDAIAAFEADPDTKVIVMIGEIGGDAEERAADYIKANVTKPVVGYVAGFTAPEGKTMGHAGAIVSGSSGTAAAKKDALEAAGVKVGKTPRRPPPWPARSSRASDTPEPLTPRAPLTQGPRRPHQNAPRRRNPGSPGRDFCAWARLAGEESRRVIDPRTPVVIGVGQVTERIDDADYRALSPVELAAEAARHALADSGADPTSLAAAVDTIVATRQFEISVPNAPAPLGKSNNFPRSVAARIGADPARAVLDKVGGQGPQALLTEFAAAIAADTADVVVLCGSDATSTARHFAPGADGVPPAGAPDFHETVEGQLEDRGFGLEEFVDRYTISHGLTGAPVQYGLLENARRARLGLTPAQYLQAMGSCSPRSPRSPRATRCRRPRCSAASTTW